MKNPFFNIVIPTREHVLTLPWTIKSCLNQDYNNYQIIVADNISQDDTPNIVKHFEDSRIKYVNSGKRLSMSHNWDFALNYVEEGYAIILGDDDGLVKDSLKVVANLIEQTSAQAVRPQNIVYHWPNVFDKNVNGMLFHVPFENSYSWIESKKLLNQVAGNLEYLPPYFLDLPTIYHGFINVEIIKNIKQRDGAFFYSCSPDMYSAVIVAAEIESYIKLKHPVIINAMSAQSNGLSNKLSQNSSEIKRFLSENIIPFNEKLVPKGSKNSIISRPILVADQFLNARAKNKLIPEIDIKNLIVHSAESAVNWTKPEQYDTVIKETLLVGKLNGLESYSKEIISKLSYRSKQTQRANPYSYDRIEKTLHIDTILLKAKNVFDVSTLIFKLTEDETIKNLVTHEQGNLFKIRELLEDSDAFLNPEMSIDNIDRYFIRRTIFKSLCAKLNDFKDVLLDLGCGEMPYKEYILNNSNITEYIGMDIKNPTYQKNKIPDKFWDGKTIPMDDNSVNVLMATELFEHLPDIQSVLKEIERVLKPGGLLFFTVPFLWPLHDVPYDEYRYTPFALERHLKSAGLESINIKPYGGWNASLAQMLGLWLKRSGLPEEKRKALSESFFPFYKQLLETDVVPDNYTNGPMIPGFSGTAKKKVEVKNEKMGTAPKSEVKKTDATKMKAIIVVYFFPKLSETFILDQIIGLLHRGVDVEIWAQAIPEEKIIHPSIIQYDLMSRVKYIQFPAEQFNSKNWKDEFLLINKIQISGNDIFHLHFGQNFVALQNLFLEISNPVIVSFHGLDASEYIRQKGPDCYNKLFERANLITTPSYEMQKILLSTGSNKEKMVVHRCGVDVKKFYPAVEENSKSGVQLLTIARLVEKKGIEYSLKAFAKINPANTIYTIIGEGPLEKRLKELTVQLRIHDKVRFLGPKSKEEIIEEINKTDIYVLTSVTANNGDKEGLPVTLIEAQSAGLPVVSSYHSGIPELVSDNETGFLCEEKDIDAIADKLNILINNKEIRKNFGRRGRVKVLEKFDISKLNVNLYNYYNSFSGTNLQKEENVHVRIAAQPKSNAYICPVCESESIEFLPFGVNPRPNVMCPNCGSLERQRMLWLYLKQKIRTNGKKLNILHIAPEESLAKKIKEMSNVNYTTIDLMAVNVQYKMDVQDLKFPSGSFDIIICSHVLEHVYDDILAMKEFLRALKSGGIALLQVPVFENLLLTVDGRDVQDPEERTRRFGQPDHFRAYGLDFYERMLLAGFKDVSEVKYDQLVEEQDAEMYRLSKGETLYICRKNRDS